MSTETETGVSAVVVFQRLVQALRKSQTTVEITGVKVRYHAMKLLNQGFSHTLLFNTAGMEYILEAEGHVVFFFLYDLAGSHGDDIAIPEQFPAAIGDAIPMFIAAVHARICLTRSYRGRT